MAARTREIIGFGNFLWLVVPGAVVGLLLILLPSAYAISLSFFEVETIVSAPTFAGWANYIAVAADSRFWNSFGNSIVYALGSIFAQIVLGVAIALVLNERFPGRTLLRGVVIVPYAVPAVAGIFIWRWMLNENFGIVTSALDAVGIRVGWFSDPQWAMFTVIFISVWLWTPFVVVSVLAGLQNVRQNLYEAAHVDGAGVLSRFWHVTIPGILPVLAVVALLRGVWMFNKFDVIWLTTGGGPLHATENLSVLAYEKAFNAFELGTGSAIAVVNGVFVLAVAVLYLRLTRARV